MKKVWKFLSSMPFAIGLLVALSAVCALSSLITQGQTYEWYAGAYGPRLGALILALGLDDAFHSWWFWVLTGVLCGNLLLCNLVRLRPLINRTRGFYSADGLPETQDAAPVVHRPKEVFAALSMTPRETERQGQRILFASKNGLGLWGPWVCHLGILLLIVGFSLGQALHREYVVYGVKGETKPIGDTGYALTIDDFQVKLRADDTVEQYEAAVTVFPQGEAGRGQSARLSVNHPASLFGMKLYQNSTGWAAALTVSKEGQVLEEQILCAGEGLQVQAVPGLVVYLNAFYPDFYLRPGYGPMTLSGALNNPAYLYSIYFQDAMVGMDYWQMEEGPIKVNDYEFTFHDPESYTLLEIKKDKFAWLTLMGGILVLLGLGLCFYVQPVQLWAREQADGTWMVYGKSPKGGPLFTERLLQATEKAKES